jgi:hypothetical protein
LVHICKKNIDPDSVQINKVASCKNLKDVKHLKLDIKNEITEKYKYLYKSKIDKIDESSMLEIEKGRYNKTPCEERLCKHCGVTEDEAHFILKCKVNQNLRESLFNNIELDNDFFFLNFSDEQKLVYLLNPASVRHVRVIGFYLKQSLELRTEVLLRHK